MRTSFALPPPLEGAAVNKKEWPGFLLARGRSREAREAGRRSSCLALRRRPRHGPRRARRRRRSARAGSTRPGRGALAPVRPRTRWRPGPGRRATRSCRTWISSTARCSSARRGPRRPRPPHGRRRSGCARCPDPTRGCRPSSCSSRSPAPRARRATGSSRNTRRARCSTTTRAYAGAHYALGLVAEQRGDGAAAAHESFADGRAALGPRPTPTCPSSSACAAPSRRARH